MPQIGERRSGATETVEWNGSRWIPVESAPPAAAAPEPEGALSRFFNGAMSTSPLNPANLVRAVAHPINTLGGAFIDPLLNLFRAGGDVKAAITGEEGDRLTPAVRAIEHLGGAVPLIGPAAIHAGEKIGNGDIAGGAGELAGLASGAALPKVTRGAVEYGPEAIAKTGGLVEKAGTALTSKGINTPFGAVSPSGLGILEGVVRGNPAHVAIAATPYVLKYGGRAIRAGGEALAGLRDAVGAEEAPAWDPAGPSRRARAQAEQRRAYAEAKMDQDFRDARTELDNEPPEVPDFGQTQTYARGGYPGMNRQAATMGDAALEGLRRAGYDVNMNGIRTQADLDRVAAGPVRNPAFMRFALDENRPSPQEAVGILKKSLGPGVYEMGSSSLDVNRPALPPSPVRGELPPARYIEAGPSEIEGRKALPPADYGSLDPDMNADFEYEAGDPEIPGLTISQDASKLARLSSALQGLRESPSFKGMVR